MIEKIVTSLEVSKQLKELGIVQESIFYWVCLGGEWEIVTHPIAMGAKKEWGVYDDGIISAFTVTEMGCMLDLMSVDDDYVHHNFPDVQAQKGIFEMLDMFRGEDIPIEEHIANLNQNLINWRNNNENKETKERKTKEKNKT